MRRADLQEERSAAQRQGPVGGGAGLFRVKDSDVVRDGDTYYLVINNLGERDACSSPCASLIDCSVPFVRSRGQ